MIQPDAIRRKAEDLYREYVQAWLIGDGGFFPKAIRGRKTPHSDDLSAASRSVRCLRAGSKEAVGFGYSIEWREVNSRRFGRNQFPARILFETADDLLRFLDRKTEFDSFAETASHLRSEFPALDSWIRVNTRTVVEISQEMHGLLQVLRWFRDNPRPNMYARELPLPVETKFIERHQRLLREWFDLVLPPHTIRSDEEHFERRYGLRYPEPHLLMRFLDPQLQVDMGFPCCELSLPLHTLAQLDAPIATVFIVENKVNLLTLPSFIGAIALGGLGNGVTLLRYVPWLKTSPIRYWGDIDVEGFAILSSLRAIFPQVESFLMDRATFDRHESLAIDGTGRKSELPTQLTDAERSLFVHCRDNNLRLEQERLSQSDVLAAILGGQFPRTACT